MMKEINRWFINYLTLYWFVCWLLTLICGFNDIMLRSMGLYGMMICVFIYSVVNAHQICYRDE